MPSPFCPTPRGCDEPLASRRHIGICYFKRASSMLSITRRERCRICLLLESVCHPILSRIHIILMPLSATLALRMLLPEPSGPDRYRQRGRLSLTLITIAGIIFRSELALLLATNTLFLLLTKRIRIQQEIIPAGIIGVVIGLTATVVVDSYFWQQFPLWPEFAAFKFNVLSGQASA